MTHGGTLLRRRHPFWHAPKNKTAFSPRIAHLLVTLDVMRICSNSADKVTCQQSRLSAVCVGARSTSRAVECLHPRTSQSFSQRFYIKMDEASRLKKVAIVKLPNSCILSLGQQGWLKLVAIVSILFDLVRFWVTITKCSRQMMSAFSRWVGVGTHVALGTVITERKWN